MSGAFSLSAGDGLNRHKLPTVGATSQKLHMAIGFCEQRVVPSAAYIGAGVKLGAALPDNDVAGAHELAAIALHAQAFRF